MPSKELATLTWFLTQKLQVEQTFKYCLSHQQHFQIKATSFKYQVEVTLSALSFQIHIIDCLFQILHGSADVWFRHRSLPHSCSTVAKRFKNFQHSCGDEKTYDQTCPLLQSCYVWGWLVFVTGSLLYLHLQAKSLNR